MPDRCTDPTCTEHWPSDYESATCQHRAADELTRHDQAAGHYDEPKHTRVMERIGNGPTVNLCNLCRAVWPCSAAIANGTACACGRTDQHGPHED